MDLKKNILKTVYWFDLFDRPLTDVEIHNFLFYEKIELIKVRRQLRKMTIKYLSKKGNLFCVKGREELFDIYKERQKFSKKKWKKAKRVGYLLSSLPYVRAVAVTQNLAINNAKEKSDIDLLIITSKKRLWAVRAIVNFSLDIFKLRNQKNKSFICPNFFVAKDRLNIKDLLLNKNDIYLPFWIASLKPIFGKKVFNSFYLKNKWVNKIYPNFLAKDFNSIRLSYIFWPIKLILEYFFLRFIPFEKKIKNKQIKKIKKNTRRMENKSIILDDKTAKMHYDDKRVFYYKKWKDNLKSVDISV
jgi:hypothetical protein